jgi:hypothetical protein
MATFAAKSNESGSAWNDLVRRVDDPIVKLSRFDHAIPTMWTRTIFKQVTCPVNDAHRLPNMRPATGFSGAVKLQDHTGFGRLSILRQPIDNLEPAFSRELICEMAPIGPKQVSAGMTNLLDWGKNTQCIAHAKASLPG